MVRPPRIPAPAHGGPTPPDVTVSFRLAPHERELLERIRKAHAALVAESGVKANVTLSDVLRTLLEKEAKALGLSVTTGKPVKARPK